MRTVVFLVGFDWKINNHLLLPEELDQYSYSIEKGILGVWQGVTHDKKCR